MSATHCPTWLVSATMAKNVEMAADKELDDLVSTLGDDRLCLREPCMAGIWTMIGMIEELSVKFYVERR